MQTDTAGHPPKSVPSLWYVTILGLPKYLKWLKQKSIVSDSDAKKLETKGSAELVSSEGCLSGLAESFVIPLSSHHLSSVCLCPNFLIRTFVMLD